MLKMISIYFELENYSASLNNSTIQYATSKLFVFFTFSAICIQRSRFNMQIKIGGWVPTLQLNWNNILLKIVDSHPLNIPAITDLKEDFA